jgi:2-amino-4-hydroxy-6-hydroxymethyldihydropteridine diphosphokinase
MARCLIGCGSNVGQRREQLDRAVELLRFMPGVSLVSVSRYRETRPIGGPPSQPPFLNGACLIETDLGPHDVMGMLAAVENTLHRERGERWGPRTIDLDLLLYDDLVVNGEALTVPHPRMATRRFVLEPCAEIAPRVEHPLAGCTLQELLDNISKPHLHVAVAGVPGSGAPEVAAAIADATLARLVHAPAPLPPSAFRSRDGDADADADARGSAELWIEREWHAAVWPWARPLAADRWPADPHGTVADYWLETLRVAAMESLPPAAFERFDVEYAGVAAGTVAPDVVILLTIAPDVIDERIAFLSRQTAPHTDVFSDLGSAAVCASPRLAGAALTRLQERLACRLRRDGDGVRNGRTSLVPRAVVTIDASDLGKAADEAVAAVEAMA